VNIWFLDRDRTSSEITTFSNAWFDFFTYALTLFMLRVIRIFFRSMNFHNRHNMYIPPVLLWISNSYFRAATQLSMLWTMATDSAYIRILKLHLKRGGLWILGRPTLDQLPKFSYPQLEERQPESEDRKIRLLRLGRQIPFFDLTAELIPFILEDAPPYKAVSYVWGENSQKTHSIAVNGQQFHVSRNVYDILRRLSSFFRPRLI
jgi:Heterokaryon incompatibility protein (HET)